MDEEIINNLEIKDRTMEELEIENHEVENLEVEKLEVENLEVENHEVENLKIRAHVIEDLEIEDLEIKNIDIDNPEIKDIEIDNLEINEIKFENQEYKENEIENFEIDKREVEYQYIEDLDIEEQEMKNLEFEDLDIEEQEMKDLEFEDLDLEDQENKDLELEKQFQILDFIVKDEDNGIRIDKYLSVIQSELTRSYIQKLIDDGKISMENKQVKSNTKVKSGANVRILLPEPVNAQIVAEDIPLDIIYEDKDFIIINKHKGLVVHPAAGHTTGTLVNALLFHCKDELSGINGVMRPGIVHRIDRDTTGVMVACKNDKAHQFIAEQLKDHSITRKYYAIVYHAFKTDGGRVEAPIGRDPKDRKKMSVNFKNGKTAATNYKVLENLQNHYACIECSLETGRTHQIRVHMASIHHPLIGDTVYGPSKDPFHLEGQALHAGVLGFVHPTTKKYVEFQAPLPEYFTTILEKLRRKG